MRNANAVSLLHYCHIGILLLLLMMHEISHKNEQNKFSKRMKLYFSLLQKRENEFQTFSRVKCTYYEYFSWSSSSISAA